MLQVRNNHLVLLPFSFCCSCRTAGRLICRHAEGRDTQAHTGPVSPLSLTHTPVLVRSLCLLPVFCYAACIYLWALKYISFQLLCVVGRIRRGRRGGRRAPCRQQTALSCMQLSAGSCSRRRRKKGSTTISTHPSLRTLLNPVLYIWVQGCGQVGS